MPNCCGVMLFNRNGPGKWELVRFATDINKRSIGVGGKLFKYFTRNYNPKMVVSYADRRWTVNYDNNLYTKLGFVLDGITEPDYKYFSAKESGCMRLHKFGFRKQKLHKKYNLPLEWTEKKMTEYLGYDRICDCGLYRYVWRPSTKTL